MKELLLPHLVCPACLPEEHPLDARILRREDDDLIEASLNCPRCGGRYRVVEGIADLRPAGAVPERGNKYERDEVVASYLWSHYGDLLEDEHCSDAYRRWSDLIEARPGLALDLGGAVGRFTFELADKCDLAVGIDNSRAFIRAARQLAHTGGMPVHLKEEGQVTRTADLRLPPFWLRRPLEFIVADVLRLPFRAGAASTIASLNLVDKVPDPLGHLREIQRVARATGAQLLLSDPFSWSEDSAAEERWLGGRTSGPWQGHGLDNIRTLLCDGRDGFRPPWRDGEDGQVWWKIRTHRNHYELIRSCYLKVTR